MKKWQKKINRRVNHYDSGWDSHVAECRRQGVPIMCSRAYRSEGFRDGAEWMLNEIIHLLRQKKYRCDKLRREGATMAEKAMPTLASVLYSRVIKDLTE